MATFRIELSMIPSDEMGRVVRDARRQQAINSTPIGKRGQKAKEMSVCPTCGEDEEDCDCESCDMEENETKVGMGRGEMPPTAGVTSEDLPRGTKIPKAKLPKRIVKNGKKS